MFAERWKKECERARKRERENEKKKNQMMEQNVMGWMQGNQYILLLEKQIRTFQKTKPKQENVACIDNMINCHYDC